MYSGVLRSNHVKCASQQARRYYQIGVKSLNFAGDALCCDGVR